MSVVVRVAIVVIGLTAMLAGVSIIAIGHGDGLWLAAVGGFLVIVPFIERRRYRSEASERSAGAPVGPGGGETPDAPVEARFRPTPEAFIDPTTGLRMRVLVDPRTGERRYVAEG